MLHPPRPRVAILALTLELYERLAPGLREKREQWVRQALIPTLSQKADVCFPRAVCRREEIEDAVATFESAAVDAILVLCLTYSPSQIALPALTRTRLPLLVWNTQELEAVDERFDVAAMIDNHGVHGTQDLSNTLLRSGVPFEYLTFHPSETEGWRGLEDSLMAASAAAAMRRARVGLLGYPFPGMGDFAVDTTFLAATLGAQWSSMPVEEYIERAADAPAEAVAETVRQYAEAYAQADDLTPSDLAATARAELALRGMVADHRLDAFSFQFMSFGEDERTETLPFVAASRLMAEGVGFAGEGDVAGALGTWLLGRLQAPATFSEVFTIDFAGNGLFMSHMGEVNVAMARRDRRPPLVARPTPITRTRGRQLAIPCALEPGPATLCALAQGPGGRWRLIASRMRIDDFGPLASLCVPHFKLLPEGDVRDWLTAYAKAGGPHHNAVCFGDARPRIRAAARLLNADYCEIG